MATLNAANVDPPRVRCVIVYPGHQADVIASTDGGWKQRGFQSLGGHNCLIGAETKLTQKLVTFSEQCSRASCNTASGKRKRSDDDNGECKDCRNDDEIDKDGLQQQLMQKQKEEEEAKKLGGCKNHPHPMTPSDQHCCSKNFVGLSGAMETAGAAMPLNKASKHGTVWAQTTLPDDDFEARAACTPNWKMHQQLHPFDKRAQLTATGLSIEMDGLLHPERVSIRITEQKALARSFFKSVGALHDVNTLLMHVAEKFRHGHCRAFQQCRGKSLPETKKGDECCMRT